MKSAMAAAGVLLWAASGRADEVHTKWGTVVQGKVLEKTKEHVRIDTGTAIAEIPAADVEKVVERPSPVGEYRARTAELLEKKAGPAEFFELARWCVANGLPGPARKALLLVLERDPDHEAARKELGYVRVGERWLTQDQAMLEQGFVRFEGRWVHPEERKRILAERKAAEKKKKEERKKRIEEEARRRAEEEAARRKAEAEKPKPKIGPIWDFPWWRRRRPCPPYQPQGWYSGIPWGSAGWGWGWHRGSHGGTVGGEDPCGITPGVPCPAE